MRLGALVGQMNFQAAIEKSEFPQPVRKDIELELGRDRKDLGVRQKGDERSGMLFVLDFTNDFELPRRLAPGKSDQIDFAVPGHLGLKPFRQRIDTLRADAVQTSREFIRSLPELSSSMQVGEDQLDGGHLKFSVGF